MPRSARPTTLATRGIAATPHYLASQAGLRLLLEGGNAVDAAVAAAATLTVVYPENTSLGGDLFALVHPASVASRRSTPAAAPRAWPTSTSTARAATRPFRPAAHWPP